MKVKASITRRTFVKGAAVSFAGTMILPRSVLGAPGQPSPNEELTKAVIGVGGMGQSHLGYPGARLLAVCDVDSTHLSSTLAKVADDVKGYHDFREVLARTDIDIIHVPTPPHWHALISIAAAEAGKDIWCEKPMSRTIGEGLKVVESRKAVEGIAHYHINEGNELADRGFKLAEKGLAAFSVGFIPDMEKASPIGEEKDLFGPMEFNGQELLEVSQVAIGSNPAALQLMKGLNQHSVIAGILEELLDETEESPKAFDEKWLRAVLQDELRPYIDEIKGILTETRAFMPFINKINTDPDLKRLFQESLPPKAEPKTFDANAVVAASIKEVLAEGKSNG